MRSGLEPNWLGFPGLPGLLLICAEIMPDKAILDQKSHIWSVLKIFHFCTFFTYDQFLLKSHKKLKFSKLTKYDFLWSKMALSGIVSTKTTKSPGSPNFPNLEA